jgi:hypothetical protein
VTSVSLKRDAGLQDEIRVVLSRTAVDCFADRALCGGATSSCICTHIINDARPWIFSHYPMWLIDSKDNA